MTITDSHVEKSFHCSSQLPKGRVAVVIAATQWVFPLNDCIQGFCSILEDPADILFIDNGSGGTISNWIEKEFPDISLIQLQENKHFCGGYNAGLQYAIDHDYDFALIVNADTEVINPRFLKDLLNAAERYPNTAFLGPQVYFQEPGIIQNTILKYPSFLRNVWSWFTYRIFGTCRSDTSEEKTVDFLNGVCVLCRINALREIGLMDETLAIYVEDTDWHWRARVKGWQSMFIPVPSIVHHQKADGYEHYSLVAFMLKRNTVYWHLKRGRKLEARLYAWCSLALGRVRMLRAILSGGPVTEHRYYYRRLRVVFRNLLRGEPLGEWFGPLYGTWNPPCSTK